MVVELAPPFPPLPATAAGFFSPNLIFALAFVLCAALQTESALYYDVLFEVGQNVFAVVSTFVALPWKVQSESIAEFIAA